MVFFGSPAFSVPSLRALLQAGFQVPLVITKPDAPRGRGLRPAPSAVKQAALEAGLRGLEPQRLTEEAFLQELDRPDFLAVVAYGKILPQEVLQVPRVAPVNLHASLLPKYRGAAPIPWAILQGEDKTGLTTIWMSTEMDAGDVLLQEEVPILQEDTAGTLSERLSHLGAGLLVRTLEGLLSGQVRPRPQEGRPSFAPPLKKEDGHIRWERPAAELERFIRAMNPWPGAFCHLGGRRLKLLRAQALQGRAQPGQLLKAEGQLLVGTGQGLLRILELQPEGKRPMKAEEFLRGRAVRGAEVLR